MAEPMLTRLTILAVLLTAAVGQAFALAGQQAPRSDDVPAFVAYYWKARPGRLQEYNDYINKVAVPIDEDARRAGVF